MVYVALVFSLVGVAMGWFANRKNNDLKERIAQTNSKIYRMRQDAEAQEESYKKQLSELRYQLMELKGELKITPEMTIEEINGMHSQAAQVLAGFHIGGCSSCSVDGYQALGEAVTANGRDLEPILVALNNLVAESDENGQVPEERLKMANVQLTF